MPDRRRFLLRASAGVATWLCSSTLLGVPPVQRKHGHKFKFSLAAYSYRDLLSGDPPAMSLFDFVDDCAKMGLEGTELTSYYFPANFDLAYLLKLKKYCFDQGLDISGTAVGNDFGVADPAKLREQVQHVNQWVDHAAVLGAPVIRIFAGELDPTDLEASHRQMVACMEECCEYAGKKGIYLALENHGGPTATADGLLEFVRDVQSPWFGVNMDTGNFHSEDIYQDLARVAPYTLNVQVKVQTTGPDGKVRPTDYVRLSKLLEDSGYRGYVVLEYESEGDPRVECPKALGDLRSI
jgi:sugar phosphate isomerase/epimerase